MYMYIFQRSSATKCSTLDISILQHVKSRTILLPIYSKRARILTSTRSRRMKARLDCHAILFLAFLAAANSFNVPVSNNKTLTVSATQIFQRALFKTRAS